MSEKLSEENRALLTGELAVLKFDVMTSDGPQNYYEMPESTLNRLLNSARAEARPAVDREAVARIIDPVPFMSEVRAEYSPREEKAFAKADDILALLSPATSPGEG